MTRNQFIDRFIGTIQKIPPGIRTIVLVVYICLILAFIYSTIEYGLWGFVFGILLLAFMTCSLYFYLIIQRMILKFIRKHQDKSMFFKTVVEYEDTINRYDHKK